jgi:hypothetical protein
MIKQYENMREKKRKVMPFPSHNIKNPIISTATSSCPPFYCLQINCQPSPKAQTKDRKKNPLMNPGRQTVKTSTAFKATSLLKKRAQL